jgi:UDP-glucose 4-epimerase
MSSTTCLVTGGAGFIGSHVVRALLADGSAVRVIDNLSTGSVENLAGIRDDVAFIEADLRDARAAARATAGVEIVFHLAALPSVPRSLADPWASHDHNVNGTMRLLEAARAAGVRRVVYSSSSSVYGDTPVLPKVETMEPLCRSPYAAAKLAGEQYVLAYARSGLLEGVALRYFNVFGPRQRPDSAYAAVIPAFLEAARSGGTAELYGDGEQTRDFTYVANVVEANRLAALAPAERASGSVVNCGAGERTSLNGLLALVERLTGREVRRRHAPPRAGDVRDSLASLERASRVIGYQVKIGLEEGLARTWDWFTG